MMKKLLSLLHGDKIIWALAILLAMLSFLPVYSASTNLVYTIGTGKATTDYLFRHFVHLFIGICIMWYFHKRDYTLFRKIAIIGMPVIALILLYTLLKGNTIGGANASRWLKIPLLGQFQPSSTAAIILLMYVAQYLTGIKDEVVSFKSSFWQLWVPVLVIIGLILPANFSTAALIFCMVCVLVFIGKYPFKYLMTVIGIGACGMLLFVLVAKAFPGAFPNRVDTWISRIDRFTGPDDGTRDLYQVENAKMAIANGGLFGVGPGKSVLKNFLPQSSSDFIFAIIVEEWGLFGGLTILGIYLLLFYRFLIAVHKAPTLFGKLLVAGLGFYLIFQALINMGVAVSLLPTTGQALPLVSSGGTAIWMTCFAIAVILSVTKKEAEIQAEEQKRKEEEALEQEMLHDLHLERIEKNNLEEA